MELTWWPLYGLRIRTPRLELRPVTDDDLDELCALVDRGIHPADEMPFLIPWTRLEPPERERGSLQWHWRCRAEWRPESWHLPLGVFLDGRLVGQQDVVGDRFAIRRVVSSGSWLGAAHQGQGIGTEMRAAMLHFAFASLDAERAETDAFADNPRSLGVTARLGYEPNGERIVVRDDVAATTLHFVLTRSRWQATRRDDITVDGLEAARDMFGI